MIVMLVMVGVWLLVVVVLVVLVGVVLWCHTWWRGTTVVLITQTLAQPSLLLGPEGGPGWRGRLGPGRHDAVTRHGSGGHRVVEGQGGGALLYLGVLRVSG